jgi:pSer/pThr/pTyr-binding forkhead associated (FHA) protein
MTVSRRPARYSKRPGDRGPGDRRKGFILTVTDGLSPGKEFYFDKSATIGRVEQCEVLLVEPGISRQHARIIDDQGVYILEDLGSANGTRLNGLQVTEGEVLRDGDYITLSQTTLQFSLLEAARGEVTAKTSLSEVEARALDHAAPRKTRANPVVGLLSTRRRKLLAAGVVALLAVAGALYGLRGKTSTTFFDQSSTPLTYSEEDDFFNSVFGLGKYDQSHVRSVLLDFEYLGGRATLQYGAWGVDKVGEVEILLNNKPVGKVPLTMGRWVYGLKLDLPRDLLKKNGTNRITFNNTRNPPNRDTWEICYLQISQEAIPPPDPRQARQQFELAKKSWEDREIEPSNMYTALVGFKKARDLLEGLAEKPELYQEALDFYTKVDKELTRKFEDGLFSARRAEKLDGDPAKARTLLLRTRRYFRKEDFRYREIQRYLDSLAES